MLQTSTLLNWNSSFRKTCPFSFLFLLISMIYSYQYGLAEYFILWAVFKAMCVSLFAQVVVALVIASSFRLSFFLVSFQCASFFFFNVSLLTPQDASSSSVIVHRRKNFFTSVLIRFQEAEKKHVFNKMFSLNFLIVKIFCFL